jgi:hypothetical protein
MCELVVSDSREDSDEDMTAPLLKNTIRAAKHENYRSASRGVFFEYRRKRCSRKGRSAEDRCQREHCSYMVKQLFKGTRFFCY